MRTEDFHFDLPEDLIAQAPLPERDASRLLVCEGGTGLRHGRFAELPKLLRSGDLLVFNDTRVIPARLFAVKDTGGRAEILIERPLGGGRALAQVRASKAPRPGGTLFIVDEPGQTPVAGAPGIEVEGREGDFFVLRWPAGDLLEVLERHGHVPLPPYIRRPDADADRERYQTLFAAAPGAVAAPTAGLHFTPRVLEGLEAAGVRSAFVTLHVGAGTFQPVRVENPAEHRMHSEWLSVPAATVEAVDACRRRGGRVVAVGTTVVRALESAARDGSLQPAEGDTDIFIYPGYRFRVIQGLITNFHLPGSTLLMLVSALGGREAMLAAYREAVAERYRFFSYGDAMLIWPAAQEASA